MPLFSRIVEKVAATPQCHLVLPSIVPCPTTGEVFDVANDLIKSLANANKKHCTFYGDLTKWLVEKNGGFRCHLFKREQLHLNNDGAKVIGTGIHHFIMTPSSIPCQTTGELVYHASICTAWLDTS
jgi:hypothetical protein